MLDDIHAGRESSNSRRGYAALYDHEVARLESIGTAAALEQIEAIISLAESHNDTAAVFQWRCSLIEFASYYGRFDRELVAFQELIAMYESEPGAQDLRAQVLWYFKWVAETLPEFVDVPAAQIEDFLQQMEDFYKREHESPAPVYALRYAIAAFMGHAGRAAFWREQWEQTPPGESDDCPACQTHTRVQALLDLEKHQEAIEAAGSLLNGEEFCESVPAEPFSRLLVPMLLSGDAELCVGMMRAIRRQVRHTAGMLSHLADHVIFLSLIPSPQTARRSACVLLKRLASATNSFHRFCAFRAAWIWVSRRFKAGQPLRLPTRAAVALPNGLGDRELVAWLRSEADSLAGAFDQRNESPRFSRLMAEGEQLIAVEFAS